MKLVKLLAKELKEWPEGAGDVVGQAIDGSLHLNGSYEENRGFTDEQYTLAKDWMSADVTKSQWQAEREKMNKPKWIRHRGGKCPVAGGTEVETRHRDGKTYSPHFHTKNSRSGVAMNAVWEHKGDALDIMAYRVIEETKDQEIEEVKDTNLDTLTYKLEIDAIEETQQIDSFVAKWGQIESPLKWRDAIIHCQAIIEDCEREIQRNVNLLDAEGLMMQKDSKKAMQHYAPDVDMSDWRNWQAGDTVECLVVPDKHKGYYFSGENYNVRCVDLDDEGTSSEVDICCEGGFSLWCPSSSFKFVSRP